MSHKQIYECDICGKVDEFEFGGFPLQHGTFIDSKGKWSCNNCFEINTNINKELDKKREDLQKDLEENLESYKLEMIEKYKKEQHK